MGLMDDKAIRSGEVRGGASAGDHVMTITNREHGSISGVLGVESFDDQEIVLETDLGTLTIRGEDLHIKQLDLESGRFAVDGIFHSCIYSVGRSANRGGRGKGFFERLLR